MNLNKICKLVQEFLKLAVESEELPPDSSDLDTVLKNLSKLETYTARVDYAEKNLKHLSSGSSRVVYMLDDEVLKLAKNDRGVAQNKVESKLKCKFINPTTKSDKDGVWKISPCLDKITEKEFEELCSINFKDFTEALSYGLKDVSGEKKFKPKCFEEVEKSEIYKDLVKIAKEYKLMPGDMGRISSWGKVDDHPTLLDAGLTREIYDEYYE